MYRTFDQRNKEDAESMDGAEIMGAFLLSALGIALVAFVVYIVAGVRLERAMRHDKVAAGKTRIP